MSHIIVGLGNPGEEYEKTRHNAGRHAVLSFAKAHDVEEWKHDKRLGALIARAVVGKEKVTLVLPQTFMNKSGASMRPLITNAKKAERLIVVHDDLDLPMGKLKIVFNRGSGGHKGVESIVRALRTEKFTRVRIGVSPATQRGKVKKPDTSKVIDFILKKWRASDEQAFKPVWKKVSDALAMIVTEGRDKAMGTYN